MEFKAKGDGFFKDKRWKEAIEQYSRGLLDDGLTKDNRGLMLSNRSQAWQNLEQWNLGLKDAHEAAELLPNHAKTLLRRAACHEKTGAKDKALEDYVRVIRIDPTNRVAGEAAVRLQDEGKAVPTAEGCGASGLLWVEDEHRAQLPPDGVFTVETLKPWDGKGLPMCVGICGKVVEVSSSENFSPAQGYGKLWAGKDSTWAMATVSLKAESANRFDFKVEELAPLELDSLAGWYKHFTHKYPVVGTMKELEGWDWTLVVEKAKTLPLPKMSER